MSRVAAVIASRGVPITLAAKMIGVGAQTLQNHLAGEHVRSDSAQKYEDWLLGRAENRNIFVVSPRQRAETAGSVDEEPSPSAVPPLNPWLVVDIFSGCGGLSLGFDLFGEGRYFRTILAIDNQEAPIAVLNRNARLLGHGFHCVGRRVDLTEFMNEAEFLAFFIQHTSIVCQDKRLAQSLNALHEGAFPKFLAEVAAADHVFVKKFDEIRASSTWEEACRGLDRQSLSQTSVVGFHEKLRLPRPTLKNVVLPALLWRGEEAEHEANAEKPEAHFLKQARTEWEFEASLLGTKRQASGRGQLNSSARRVAAFVSFLETKAMNSVREAWVQWRAQRLTLRTRLFDDAQFAGALEDLYSTKCQVSVLVGGPPCQGFSRIGRGKIRSLREALVQVHSDESAVDARNLLFQQYVMVLGALRPNVFLFENVQHFQSTVRADGVEFQATEVLSEAIANISDGEVQYEVSSRVIDASRYGVPQTRQRYFMAGVKKLPEFNTAARDAESCLSLRRFPEVPLALALSGLPEPEMVGGIITGSDAMKAAAPATGPHEDVHPYAKWIRQSRPGTLEKPNSVDAHAARAARADDAAFFALMGPGKRWMDYRADEAKTIDELNVVLDALLSIPDAALKAVAKKSGQRLLNKQWLKDLRSRLDGSLPLRLLLEQASTKLGTSHHLLNENYLAKRDGNHGDWVARMDSTRPAKTIVSHMGKDTYAYVHPSAPRTISVREAARIQTFPDWFVFEGVALTDAFKMVGNAVPPMLSHGIAGRVVSILAARTVGSQVDRSMQRA
jgi:DNA-cytosine methyltransferase